MVQRPFQGSPKAPPDAGPVVCSLMGFVPRSGAVARIQLPPIMACYAGQGVHISDPFGLFRHVLAWSRGATRGSISQANERSWRIYGGIRPSNSLLSWEIVGSPLHRSHNACRLDMRAV